MTCIQTLTSKPKARKALAYVYAVILGIPMSVGLGACGSDDETSMEEVVPATPIEEDQSEAIEPSPAGTYDCRNDLSLLPNPSNRRIMVKLINAVDSKPFAGITVKVCEISDVSCETPIGAPLTSSTEGELEVPLDAADDLYLEVSDESVITTLATIPKGTFATRTDVFTLPIVAESSKGLLQIITGNPYDETKGIVSGEIGSCNDGDVSGLSVAYADADDMAHSPTYFKGDLPAVTQNATDAKGRFMVTGVPEGIGTITVMIPNEGGTMVQQTIAREGAFTISLVTPQLTFAP